MRKWVVFTISILVLLAAADFLFVHKEHVVLSIEALPGFSAIYGLIATTLITVISKGIGHAFLMKPDDYYETSREKKEGGTHHD